MFLFYFVDWRKMNKIFVTMLKIRNIFEKLPSVHGTKAADLFLSAIYSAANRSNSFFPSIVESENGYSLCIKSYFFTF